MINEMELFIHALKYWRISNLFKRGAWMSNYITHQTMGVLTLPCPNPSQYVLAKAAHVIVFHEVLSLVMFV